MFGIQTFIETFIPLFVAMSPLTALPIFLSMTDGMTGEATRVLAHRAVITGLLVAVVIILLGQALFGFLGITLDDLRVAGGIILLLIAIHDLIYTRETRKRTELGTDVGAVPLGVPLIVGPATLTTCVVLADTQGRFPVVVSLVLNLTLIWLILFNSDHLKRVVPDGASKAFGKVMSLFLAAIAVAMLRTGIVSIIQSVAQSG